MRLDANGRPIHTRSHWARCFERGDGRIAITAGVLDVRKHGVVPVACDLQGSGIVHHMEIDAVIDPERRTVEEIRARQPAVAFEPGAKTNGEGCRDPIERIEAVAGASIDGDFAERMRAAIGGPLGCFHVFTLAFFLAGAAERALAARDEGAEWRAGERSFLRDLVFDGFENPAGQMEILAQLDDLDLRPAPEIAAPFDRFRRQSEIRCRARIEMGEMILRDVEAHERRRTFESLDQLTWQPLEAASEMKDLSLTRGATATIIERLGDGEDVRPLRDLLVMLAPALLQCASGFVEAYYPRMARATGRRGMGPQPDSCYMWRRGGPLEKLRESG